MINLGRAFVYAGARSIISSMWNVNDASTSDLMLLFYELLYEHPKDLALQEAKQKLIRLRQDFAAPFYWAPFIAYGDMRKIF